MILWLARIVLTEHYKYLKNMPHAAAKRRETMAEFVIAVILAAGMAYFATPPPSGF
jgi:hypothetical protein